MATFLELQNQVAYALDDLQFGYFTTTQVKFWINNAQKEVQKRLLKAGQNYYIKPVQTTLVVNQSDYVLPDDFKKEHRLEIVISGTAPNESIQPLSKITLSQKDFVSSGPGTPTNYDFKRNRLVVYPAPSVAYVLRMYYSYLVTDMVLDSDQPDVPASYHELIGLLAAEDGFLKDGRASELLIKKIATYQRDLDSDAQERNQDTSRTIVEHGNFESGAFYF